MSQSIAVFGAGPGLGQAVARRYAREGYAVVLVARRQEPLGQLARQLTSDGARAHAITAENTPYHARIKAAKAAGDPVPETPAVNPDRLAELLWTMHRTRDQPEATYPEGLFGR